jgi:hypothetical protein
MKIELINATGLTYVFDYNGIEIKVIAKNAREAAQRVKQMFLNTNHNVLEIDLEGWE